MKTETDYSSKNFKTFPLLFYWFPCNKISCLVMFYVCTKSLLFEKLFYSLKAELEFNISKDDNDDNKKKLDVITIT